MANCEDDRTQEFRVTQRGRGRQVGEETAGSEEHSQRIGTPNISMCIYIYTYTCIYLYVYTCVYSSIHVCIHAYGSYMICLCVYVHM